MNTSPARILSTHFLMLSTLSCAAFAGTLSPELKSLPATRSVEVIVKFAAGASSASIKHGTKLADLPDGALYRMTAGQAAAVANQTEAAAVAPNRMVYATGNSAPVYDYTPQSINEPSPGQPFNFLMGQGVGVAVID